MDQEKLMKTVARLMKSPKGILAIDESAPTCDARFSKLGVQNTEEKRREYRELLVTTPGIEEYVSGYILFDETIRQSTLDGKGFTSVLEEKGIEIGIKVDEGLEDFSLDPLEKVTKGIEGLLSRLREYKNMGATFAKWRAVYLIGEKTPTEDCMKENANLLAKYASVCQEQNIVPIVEPEVLMDGGHSIEKCYEVTAHNLDILFKQLRDAGVFIPGIILKTNMILPGKDAPKSSPEEVASLTLKCFREHVSPDVGGIVLLSGGQDDLDATLNLNAIHKSSPLPWPLSFSYGRAIQNKALESWAKNPDDVKGDQALLLEMAKNNSLASIGEYPSSRTI